tara:strand:- start:897 stop:1610 length:714 start_codon:yes stop_codon:yes gene_type:complete
MDMCQGEIADLLCISNSTVHRIAKKLGITLARKVRNGNDNEVYPEARESEFDNVERAEHIEEAKFATEATGAVRAAREAEIRFKRSSEGRLKAKLVGVTSKHQRYEITYGHCILEFERLQYKLKNRGPLPSREPRQSTMHKGALEEAQKRKAHGIAQGKRLFDMLGYDQRVTVSDAAAMLGDSIPRTASYLKKLVLAEKIHRVRDLVVIEGQPKKQWRWVFSKSDIEAFHSGFEDGQ